MELKSGIMEMMTSILLESLNQIRSLLAAAAKMPVVATV